MKTRLLAIALLLAVPVARSQERIIVIRNSDDITPIVKLLNSGWTVKHQSVAITSSKEPVNGYSLVVNEVMVFTLSPPPPEELARQAAEERKALEEKRAKWLREHRPQLEKP